MRVSVQIPTFNSEKHLPECLETVLSQKFRDVEILIADNCSTDATTQVIKTFAARDSRIRWWQNPVNLGMIGNHNVLLKQAAGEYIKFVHADDKLLSDSALTKLVAMLDAHPSAVLAGSLPQLLGTSSQPMIVLPQTGLYNGREMIMTSLERNTNFIGQPTLTLFRKLAAKRGFDERFNGHLDYEMWCHLLEQGDFAYLAEPLATWRVHETQQTAKNARTKAAEHEHLEFIETYYAKAWLRQLATRQMLFTQIYQLRKRDDQRSAALAAAMTEQLSAKY